MAITVSELCKKLEESGGLGTPPYNPVRNLVQAVEQARKVCEAAMMVHATDIGRVAATVKEAARMMAYPLSVREAVEAINRMHMHNMENIQKMVSTSPDPAALMRSPIPATYLPPCRGVGSDEPQYRRQAGFTGGLRIVRRSTRQGPRMKPGFK